jgi:pilus assembly protein Flp/PilA
MGNPSLWLGINPGENTMNNLMLKLHIAIQNFVRREEGQDLVEYALVVALIAFAATAAMKTLASDINGSFSNIASALTSNIT